MSDLKRSRTRRNALKADKRSLVPWVVAALMGVVLLGGLWAVSDNLGTSSSPRSASAPVSQSTGLGTSNSIDQPLKTDLQK